VQVKDLENPEEQVMEFDMDKLRSTIKQFVRDWAEEVSLVHYKRGWARKRVDVYSKLLLVLTPQGKAERDVTYTPLVQELMAHFLHVLPSER
jgi:hypothetical protein